MLTRRRLIAAAPGLLGACTTQASTQSLIQVTGQPGSSTGEVAFEQRRYPCMLGRSGIVSAKHEGDGGTPAGVFPLRRVYYRPDRLERPVTALRAVALSPHDGWCDAPSDPNYNKPVVLPYAASAEALWRQDGAYDVFAVIGYNDAPIVAGAGSAIFLHVIRQDGAVRLPTAGCVALEKEHLLDVLSRIRRETLIRIG